MATAPADRAGHSTPRAFETPRTRDQFLGLALQAGRLVSWEYDPASSGLEWLGRELGHLHGLSADDAEPDGRGLRVSVHPADKPLLEGMFRAAIGPDEHAECEIRLVCNNGDERWISVYVARRTEPNRHSEFIGISRDITGRKRASDALRESGALIRLASAADRLGACELDIPSLTFTASPSCKLIFGRGPGDVFTFADLVASVQRTDQKRLKDAIELAIRSKSDIDIEICLAGANPLHQRIRFHGCVVNDERPRLVAICAAERRQNSSQPRHALTSDKLTRELNHRLRNIFPVILTIVKHTATRYPQATEYRHALERRLRALAATAGLIDRTGADSIDIEDLIRLELAPFQDGDNILISGPNVWIQRALAQDFAIVVHELTTNAAKHGALSNMQGRLSVNWKLVPNMDGNRSLALEWVERHGPKTAPPKNFGFGMMVVGESGSLLGGTASVDFASEGLRYRLSIPAERLRGVNGKDR